MNVGLIAIAISFVTALAGCTLDYDLLDVKSKIVDKELTSFEGQLDSSYDSKAFGKVIYQGNEQEKILGMFHDGSGKILSVVTNGNRKVSFIKYNKDGSLFNGFGNNGYKLADTGPLMSSDYARYAFKMDSNNRLLLVTTASGGSDYRLRVVRFLPSGDLDLSFGNQGKIETASALPSYPTKVETDLSGNIWVVGMAVEVNLGVGYKMSLWRFTPNGTVDTSFNGTGQKFYGNTVSGGTTTGKAQGESIALYGSTHLIIGGEGEFKALLWKIDLNGNLDATFGTGGIVKFAIPPGYTATNEVHVTNLKVLSSGKIIAAGYAGVFNSDAMVWQRNLDGSSDTSYAGGAGFVMLTGLDNTYKRFIEGIHLDSSENLYAVARASKTGTLEYMMWKLTSAGAYDPAFSSGGALIWQGGPDQETDQSRVSMALDVSGIYICDSYMTSFFDGRILQKQSDLRISKRNFDGSTINSFQNSGFKIYNEKVTVTKNFSVTKSVSDPLGRSYHLGVFPAGDDGQKLALYRIGAKGTLDVTFGNGGYLFLNTHLNGTFDIDEKGRLVVSGVRYDGAGNLHLTIARYLSNGSLDPSFTGSSGLDLLSHDPLSIEIINGSDKIYPVSLDLKIDKLGRAYVALLVKEAVPGAKARVAALRFLQNGNLDSTFGNAGKYIGDELTETPLMPYSVFKAVVDSKNRLLLAGSYAFQTSSFYNQPFSIMRWTDAGALDADHGVAGVWSIESVVSSVPNVFAVPSLSLDSQDRLLLLVINIPDLTNVKLSIVRLTETRVLDTFFSGSGVLSLSGLPENDQGSLTFAGMVLGQDDSIFVFSPVAFPTGNINFEILKLKSDGQRDPLFAEDGLKLLTINAPLSLSYVSAHADSAGGILVSVESMQADTLNQVGSLLVRFK